MADKFLESMDMEEIKEDMRMTRLGQMLLNDGITEGRIQGQTLNSVRIIRHKLEKGISADIVADFLEEDPDYIKQIYALIQSQPDLTDLQIAELVLNERKKDILDWSIAAGNPCKVIRRITEDDRRKLFHNEEIDNEAWTDILSRSDSSDR